MSMAVINSDAILDVTGKPVGADVAMFLKAIDRLLTVGAYYSHSHEQYRRAAETQCAAMVAAIEPRASLSLEVAAAGLVVDGCTVDPHLRVARQIHDLLVSLNVASLEVSARLTAADLRQAIAALQAHRLELAHAQSFRTVTIADLPATVSVASRRVSVLGDDSEGCDEGSGAGRNGMDPATVRADRLHEVMAMLRTAIGNLDGTGAGGGAPASGQGHQQVISRKELQEIHDGVQRLLEREPDVSELAKLMALARQTLELSGDPDKSRLMFDQLRHAVCDENVPERRPEPTGASHSWTVAELAEQVAALAKRAAPLPEPVVAARRDQLAIGFRLLDAGPGDSGFEPALAILHRACGSPEFGNAEADVFASALVMLANHGRKDVIDRALPRLLPEIRSAHPETLAQIWSGIDADLAPPALAVLWPHLANDLFLGLESAQKSALTRCCLLAGRLGIDAALEELPRLSMLPGSRRRSTSDQVFMVPPMRARCLHVALLRTAAAESHAPHLYRELRRRPPDALTGIVTAAVEAGGEADRELLLVLLQACGHETPSPQLVEVAAALLLETLLSMPAARRREAWTAAAIAWLGNTVPGRSRELLRRVTTEKRWLLWAAWPESCRKAAFAALARSGQAG